MSSVFSKKNIVQIIIIFIFATAIFFFINHFIRSENYVYFGDYSEYFEIFQHQSALLRSNNFSGSFQNVTESINSGNYNASTIIPLELFGVLNDSRLAYILSIYIIYFIPSCLAFLLLINNLSQKTHITNSEIIGLLSTYFVSPVLLSPLLQSEPAIGGFVLIFISLYLYFKVNNYSDKIYFKSAAFIGISLSLLPIFRRWYIYYVIAFFISIFIDFVVNFIKKKSKKTLIFLIANYLLIIIFSTLSFLVCSGNLYKKFIEIGFGNQYSFFRYENRLFLLESIGYSNIAILIFSLIKLIKNEKFRRITLFFLSVLVSSTLLFLRTQDFSVHHIYLIMPIILLIIGLWLVTWRSKYKIQFIVIFTIFNVYNFVSSTLPNNTSPLGNNFLLSTVKLHPLIRTDTKDLKQIFNFLSNTVKIDETIYVLNPPTPTGNQISDGIFKNYCRDQKFDKKYICDQIMQTYLIDLLNGFPYHFFDADFVLTVDPITDSGNQQVIIKLIDFVNTSKNYILINKMQDADVTVNIYKRINKIPNDQINSLLNEFKILYPNSIFDKNNFLE